MWIDESHVPRTRVYETSRVYGSVTRSERRKQIRIYVYMFCVHTYSSIYEISDLEGTLKTTRFRGNIGLNVRFRTSAKSHAVEELRCFGRI